MATELAGADGTGAVGPRAVATGLGPWPGSDPLEACRVVFGELADSNLPFVPLLAARGAGSDIIGRTLAVMPEVFAETAPYGWRLVPVAGVDHGRLLSFWRDDLLAVETVARAYGDGSAGSGPGLNALKVQFAGPAQLWSNVRLGVGERAVRDYGARRDLSAALAEGVEEAVKALLVFSPGTRIVVQLDETLVSNVLEGTLKTSSGYQTHRSVERQEVRQAWSTVIDAAHLAGASEVWVNLVGQPTSAIPWELIADSRADGLVSDMPSSARGLDRLSEFIDSGRHVCWSAVRDDSVASQAGSILQVWRDLGFGPRQLGRLVLAHRPGLASGSVAQARAALKTAVYVASAINEQTSA